MNSHNSALLQSTHAPGAFVSFVASLNIEFCRSFWWCLFVPEFRFQTTRRIPKFPTLNTFPPIDSGTLRTPHLEAIEAMADPNGRKRKHPADEYLGPDPTIIRRVRFSTPDNKDDRSSSSPGNLSIPSTPDETGGVLTPPITPRTRHIKAERPILAWSRDSPPAAGKNVPHSSSHTGGVRPGSAIKEPWSFSRNLLDEADPQFKAGSVEITKQKKEDWLASEGKWKGRLDAVVAKGKWSTLR